MSNPQKVAYRCVNHRVSPQFLCTAGPGASGAAFSLTSSLAHYSVTAHIRNAASEESDAIPVSALRHQRRRRDLDPEPSRALECSGGYAARGAVRRHRAYERRPGGAGHRADWWRGWLLRWWRHESRA